MKIYGYSIPLPHYTIILTNVKGVFLTKFVENQQKDFSVGYLYKKTFIDAYKFNKRQFTIWLYSTVDCRKDC